MNDEKVLHRVIYEDGAWEEWVGPSSDLVPRWTVPEYHPPARVEAWLTLPPGVVVARDQPDWEAGCEYEKPWLGPTPPENRATTKRFIAEFGEEAAYQWKFPGVPSALGRVMRDVFADVIKDHMHDMNRQVFGDFIGKTATIPFKKEGV